MALAKDLRLRLEEVLSRPTAPFAEGRVHARILAAVRASPLLRARTDPYGNVLVALGSGAPRLLFACHTDHPALSSLGDGTARVLGGLRADALPGARVRAFDPSGPRGRVERVVEPGPPTRVALRLDTAAPRGLPLILDLPGVRFSGSRVRGRAVDDLCAVAACLTLFDRLARTRFPGSVGALFTRAEEVGFAGALGWVRRTRLPRTTTIVNLEMSSARPHTPQGSGPVLRVGDRITTFDPGVSAELEEAARAVAGRDPSFAWQRALMDGGACEATVYAHAGFRTGALCLPLKNYHNHAPRGGVAMEHVHEDDAENLVRWMEAYARAFQRPRKARGLDRRLDTLWRKHRRALERTAGEGGAPS